MGSCCNLLRSQPEFVPQQMQKKSKKPRPNSTMASKLDGQWDMSKWDDQNYNHLFQSFPIISILQEYLYDISYTENDLRSISSNLTDFFIQLGYKQNDDIKKKINSIIQENTDKILNKNLNHDSIKYETLKEINDEAPNIKQSAVSRIQLKMANILRMQDIDEKKIEKVHLRKFYKHVKYAYYANYQKMNEKQIDQLVQLETWEYITSKFTKKVSFRYHFMKQESEKINDMLSDVFQKDKQTIANFKYDLSSQQSIKAADISRRACNYHDRGIYILLTYFVRSCRKLQQKGYKIKQIEKKLEKVLDKIKDKYPPGADVDKTTNDFKALSKVDVKGQPFIRTSSFEGNKSQSLDKIIVQNAVLAQKNLLDFEDLIRATCLERCISYKAGLKLNPKLVQQVSQKKAIIRIKQKMLLRNKQDFNGSSKGRNIDQILIEQQQNYTKIVRDELQKLDQIEFKVSDMLRGKCTFISISDIIETVTAIKDYVFQHPELRIVQIQNRFSGPVPISDVTMKIAYLDEVVAQLQLTLQTNKAAYDFAHRIYEFNRCKVFSKIKIIHNYYEQYTRDFKQIVGRALQLSEQQTEEGLYVHKDAVLQFFNMNQEKILQFKDILIDTLKDKKQEIGDIKKINQLSDFLMVVFSRNMKQPIEEITSKALNVVYNSNSSQILLGMIVFQIFRDVEITDLSAYEQWYSYLQFLKQIPKLTFSDEWCKKVKFSSRAIIKIMEAIHLFKVSRNGKINEYEGHLINSYGKQSIQYCSYLMNYGKIKDYSKQYKDSNQTFCDALNTLQSLEQKDISQVDKIKIGQKITVTQLLIAQSFLKLRKSDKASQIIKQITNKFRQGQPNIEYILCELLNSQCYLYKDVNKFFEEYQRTVKKADSLGISLRGRNIAQSQYRIGQYLWDKKKKKQALDVHFRNAFQEFGAYMIGRELYEKMCQVWDRYKSQNIPEPQLKPNGKLKQLYLQNAEIDSKKCYFLSKVNWPHLTELNLWENYIGPSGCKFICQAKWPRLKRLNLYYNRIGDQGCSYLAMSDWPQLRKLVLAKNNITSQGCRQLIKAQWTGINSLSLYENQIGDVGCQFLKQSYWPNLNQLNLSNNKISSKGCQYLEQTNWERLIELKIWNNNIGQQGCKYLSQGKWPVLERIYLWNNNLNARACNELCNAQWAKLKLINLTANKITQQDTKQLQNKFPNAKIPI